MRTFLLIIFQFVWIGKMYGQTSQDSLAIVQLLEKEGLTWRMGDAEGHAACWAVKPNGRVLISTVDGRVLNFPSEVVAKAPASRMTDGGFSVHSNYRMDIGKTFANVVHDEISINKEGKETLSQEVRMLEKINGVWKLVGQSIHQYAPEKPKKDTTSYIQTVDITTGRIETVLAINKHFEAPNWHPANYLILNSYGKLYTLDILTKKMNVLPTGFAVHNNNDHGISPDKKWLAISHVTKEDTSKKPYKSAIYILPIGGGEPRRITSEVMSFWHGWSADGKTLAYCGERNGNYDVYTISVEGGKETRLTTTEGLDDGPDYSPDGKYIYFNSYRTGRMQIWKMNADGSNPEQLTFDENSNWFPHPSPDGRWLVYISYQSDEKQAHLFGKQVKLRLLDLKTKEIKDLTPVFFGGQGTINVPSWSSDSKKLAFVSYAIK